MPALGISASERVDHGFRNEQRKTSLSPDGLSLYYGRPGSYGNHDVFVSKRPSLDTLFGEGENLGATINSSGKDLGARIASDGSLYYSYNSGTQGVRIWRAEAETPMTPTRT